MTTNEERRRVLGLVAAGKISAEQASALLAALEHPPRETAERLEPAGAVMEGLRSSLRWWRLIPFWAGVATTVVAALGFAAVARQQVAAWWLLCLLPLFALGAILSSLGAGAGRTRWLFLNVDRSRRSDGPRRVSFGFPLPLRPVSWFLRTFGKRFRGLRHTAADEVIQALGAGKQSHGPLVIDVNDENGDKVQIYLGE